MVSCKLPQAVGTRPALPRRLGGSRARSPGPMCPVFRSGKRSSVRVSHGEGPVQGSGG